MRFTFRVVTFLSFAAAAAGAQAPGMPGRSEGAPAARLLLENTGELALTDQQVVRLAAIARRSEARRAAIRSSLDSARGRFSQPADSAARRQFATRLRADAERAREQMRVDQRDAIAVLTPDQQAKAWDMVANRGRGMRASRGRDMGARVMRGRGMGGGDMRRMRRPPMPMRDRRDDDAPVRMRQRDRVPAPRPPADQ